MKKVKNSISGESGEKASAKNLLKNDLFMEFNKRMNINQDDPEVKVPALSFTTSNRMLQEREQANEEEDNEDKEWVKDQGGAGSTGGREGKRKGLYVDLRPPWIEKTKSDRMAHALTKQHSDLEAIKHATAVTAAMFP